MQKVKAFFQQLTFSEKSIPVVIFIITLLGFGLIIPNLGFYMDDWHYVFYARSLGIESLQKMLTYDSRPNAGWLYMLGFRLLGSEPFAWHSFTYVLVFTAAWTYWLFLKALWKEQGRKIAYIAVLFAVYPFFMLHSSPIGYTHLWVGLIAYNLSMLLMVKSTKYPAPQKWVAAMGAMALVALHLFTSEYFAGLELIRIVILWSLLSRNEKRPFQKVSRVILNWLPYLFVLGVFFYWRVAVFQNPEGVTRNEPVILEMLLSAPLKAVTFLITAFITDTISVLTLGWQKATNASLFRFDTVYAQFRLVVSAIGFGVVYFYFSRFDIRLYPK